MAAMAARKQTNERRYTRPELEHEETTSMTGDAVLDLVRNAFVAKNPGKQVREVRWTLVGVAIDHVPAAMAG